MRLIIFITTIILLTVIEAGGHGSQPECKVKVEIFVFIPLLVVNYIFLLFKVVVSDSLKCVCLILFSQLCYSDILRA